MRNDAQGFQGNLCHFSFACWFKKMPQITETRKNNAMSLVHTSLKWMGFSKDVKLKTLQSEWNLMRVRLSQEYLTQFFMQNDN